MGESDAAFKTSPTRVFRGSLARRDNSSDADEYAQWLMTQLAVTTANPKAKTFPFKELHQILEKDYQVETRSVTNFFKDILPKYELVGGTRTRSIVLKAGGKK